MSNILLIFLFSISFMYHDSKNGEKVWEGHVSPGMVPHDMFQVILGKCQNDSSSSIIQNSVNHSWYPYIYIVLRCLTYTNLHFIIPAPHLHLAFVVVFFLVLDVRFEPDFFKYSVTLWPIWALVCQTMIKPTPQWDYSTTKPSADSTKLASSWVSVFNNLSRSQLSALCKSSTLISKEANRSKEAAPLAPIPMHFFWGNVSYQKSRIVFAGPFNAVPLMIQDRNSLQSTPGNKMIQSLEIISQDLPPVCTAAPPVNWQAEKKLPLEPLDQDCQSHPCPLLWRVVWSPWHMWWRKNRLYPQYAFP